MGNYNDSGIRAVVAQGVLGRHRHWPHTRCMWGGECPVVRRGHWRIALGFGALISIGLLAAIVDVID